MKMKKTLVIGHTSGIGEAIYLRIPGAVGVSRSTGHDIDIGNFALDLSEYSSIVLNAYGKFTSQLKMLYSLVENPTFNSDTLIVVMSSVNALYTRTRSIERSKYAIEKFAINEAARDLVSQGYNISTVSPGYVDTDYNKNKAVPKMDPAAIGAAVAALIDSFEEDRLLFREVVLEKPVMR